MCCVRTMQAFLFGILLERTFHSFSCQTHVLILGQTMLLVCLDKKLRDVLAPCHFCLSGLLVV